MEICYKLGAQLARMPVDGKSDFLLTNRNGSYYYHNFEAKNGGWFVHEQKQLFRVLAEIRIAAPKVSSIVSKLYAVEQQRGKVREYFFLPFHENALIYKTSPAQDIDLVFDVRQASDDTNKGRFYDISTENGSTIIRFTKDTHKFPFFVAINARGKSLNRWEKRCYDTRIRAVCRAVRFRSGHLVITAGTDRGKVLKDNTRIAKNTILLIAAQRKYADTFIRGPIEESVARFALDSLTQSFSSSGIFSGLSRHFIISRDELISVKALFLLGEQNLVQNILFRQLRSLQPDGWLPDAYKSADASCWLFLRLFEFMKKINNTDRLLVEEKLVDVIDKMLDRHSKNNLAWNHPDYSLLFGKPVRSHAVIEMQAFRLMMYKFAHELTKNNLYQNYEDHLRLQVRELFWNGKMLADGLADFTPRPSIFLAAYIYPQLLSCEEWKTSFRNALDSLWLDWGGIASIDKQLDSDSRFWINNIAAIVMHRVDKKSFKTYIDKIYSASKEDLLWKGCVGMPSESRDSGDVASALSAATFIELSDELRM